MQSRLERAEQYLKEGTNVDQARVAIDELMAALELPEFPIALDYLLRIYFRLRRRKSMGANGINKVEWPDIDAFIRRAKVDLTAWEIEIIENLDDVYCIAMAQDNNEPLIPSDANAALREDFARAGRPGRG